ncbi:MAG: hypothetical protein ACK5LR_03575 [Mangrovibacterium sp.]
MKKKTTLFIYGVATALIVSLAGIRPNSKTPFAFETTQSFDTEKNIAFEQTNIKLEEKSATALADTLDATERKGRKVLTLNAKRQ